MAMTVDRLYGLLFWSMQLIAFACVCVCVFNADSRKTSGLLWHQLAGIQIKSNQIKSALLDKMYPSDWTYYDKKL